jgi:hypothetical protein
MSDPNTKRSVHIFTAKASDDNDDTRKWQPDGDYMILKSHQGEYFTHALRASEDIDLKGVQAGRGRGYASIKLEAGDEVGSELCEEWRAARVEVVVTYRQWKQFDGEWTNFKTVTLWGYIASADIKDDQAGSMGFEVHVVRVSNQNDALGTRDYSIDCITGSSTIKGGQLTRQPEHLDTPGMTDQPAGNWAAPFNG